MQISYVDDLDIQDKFRKMHLLLLLFICLSQYDNSRITCKYLKNFN